MGLKEIISEQISKLNLPTDDFQLKIGENSTDTQQPAPLSADKTFGANFLGGYNRTRIANKFDDQQQTLPNINGVTTKTDFEIKIDAGQSQESVLKKAFEQMARQAGLSDEKFEGADMTAVESFVKERMDANTNDKGEVYILSRTTQKPFSADEWAKFQKSGSIIINPTGEDIAALQSYKNNGESADFKAGQAAADVLMKAVNEGFNIWNHKPLGESVPPAVSDALQTISQQQNNGDFQEGLINKLGAENFLKAEKYLNATPYENVMRNSLSVASQNNGSVVRVNSSDKPVVSVQQQIVQKADIDTLARLAGNPDKPMNSDFLVAAGQKIVKNGNGWRTVDRGMATQNVVDPNTAKIFEAIGKDKNASAELLKDADFVKNALTASEAGQADEYQASNALGSIFKSALDPDFVKNNPAEARKILSNISNVLAKPDDIARVKVWGQNAVSQTVREDTANALADVFGQNPELLSDTSNITSSKEDRFEKKDLETLLSAIEQHPNAQTKLAVGVTQEYTKLIDDSVIRNSLESASNAARLRSVFIGVENNSRYKTAEQIDKAVEMFSKGLSLVGAEFDSDIVDKGAEVILKTDNKGEAIKTNNEAIAKLRDTNTLNLLRAFEKDSFSKQSTAQDAKQFLADLKTVNDALPDDRKILDANGRLKDVSKLSSVEEQSMADIVFNTIGTAKRSPEVENAVLRLSQRMSATRQALEIPTITEQTKWK